MVELQVLGSSVGSLKSVVEIARSLLTVSKEAAVAEKAAQLLEKVSEAQTRLLDAQQMLAEMQQELAAAREALNHRARLDRYELIEPHPGTGLYQLKAELRENNEPTHYICPNCKDVLNELSILQQDETAAYCRNKACGQVFDIAQLPPKNEHSDESRFY